jgi:hypothetical protein
MQNVHFSNPMGMDDVRFPRSVCLLASVEGSEEGQENVRSHCGRTKLLENVFTFPAAYYWGELWGADLAEEGVEEAPPH